MQQPIDDLHQRQRRHHAECAAVAVGAAAFFAVLLALVLGNWGPLARLDHTTVSALHPIARRHTVSTAAIRTLAELGGPVTMRALLLLVAVWLLRLGTRTLAGWAAALALTGWLAARSTQLLVDRPRPHFPDPVTRAAGSSFPSGPAMASLITCAALTALLWPRANRAGRAAACGLAAALALAVGWSGIALGLSWPSDVLAGWLGAAAVLAGVTAGLELWHPGALLRDSWRLDRRTRPRVQRVLIPEGATRPIEEDPPDEES
ncbi:phosphatase PAP2 family protein [Kitasatospora sp. NPDC094015]|uniref:phosphatase PAP2 family protein n=1 Tax=Kitasatospora sp. NPDC094015 TaxID=3155205 RepID=UPI003320690F